MKMTKKLVLIFVSVFMLFLLSGCNEEKKAVETLNSAVAALQSGDFETAAKYIKNNENLTDNEFFKNTVNAAEAGKAVFSKMSCEVNSVEKTDNKNVVINADVKNVDMKSIISNSISELFSLAFSNALASEEDQMSDEEMQNKMMELIINGINAEDTAVVSKNIDIKVVKTDDGWKVNVDENVADAVTGGMVSTVKSFGGMFSE